VNISSSRHLSLSVLFAAWLSVVIAHAIAPAAALGQTTTQQPPATSGRVAATITAQEGSVRIPGADVELRSAEGKLVVAKTTSDAVGQVVFFDVPPGRYIVAAARPGFDAAESSPLDVRAGEVAQVLLDINLTFVAPGVEVRASASPTDSIQPVSTSDMLSGSVLDVSPVEGDDFQRLLPLLPGVVRGPDGRLRAKGGQATQGALQISSTSLIDPSTGDFDLQLPGQSLETVELLANPFAAEYGRFSTSIVQIRTRRGTNDWEYSPGNLMPRFRKGFAGIRGFEPRFSVRGPLIEDRLFLSQDVQFRYVKDPVRSLPGEPDIKLKSFDSFSRLDGVLSARHSLGGMIVLFPRTVDHITMNTFRPPDVAPEFAQSGASGGAQDRFAFSPSMVLESTLAYRQFEVNISPYGTAPMVFAPPSESGNFFNRQEREVRSIQWVESLSMFRDQWVGQHVFKFGTDLQHSSYDGFSESRLVEIRRMNGTVAERITFDPRTTQDVSTLEFAAYGQDTWRIGSRLTIEAGLRMDREAVIERVNWSPRGGASLAVLPEGRGILRGGVGRFSQRTPLNIGAFTQFEGRLIERFDPDGRPVGAPLRLVNTVVERLETPKAITGNIEWDQRFGRRVLLKVNYLQRGGGDEYIVEPDAARGAAVLRSTGTSKYRELELTARYLGGERRDLTISYVRSHGEANLNNYDQFYGNFRNPILRPDEHNLIPTDVPNRLLIRGTIGLPGKWDFAPVIEMRSGFPWSAVNEYYDFVGPRNRAGRLSNVNTLDFSLSRPWHFGKHRFRAGIRVYNVFGAASERDVQNNVTSPDYGRFFNPIERSIGFMFGSVK
jgi:hypothetical protein